MIQFLFLKNLFEVHSTGQPGFYGCSFATQNQRQTCHQQQQSSWVGKGCCDIHMSLTFRPVPSSILPWAFERLGQCLAERELSVIVRFVRHCLKDKKAASISEKSATLSKGVIAHSCPCKGISRVSLRLWQWLGFSFSPSFSNNDQGREGKLSATNVQRQLSITVATCKFYHLCVA